VAVKDEKAQRRTIQLISFSYCSKKRPMLEFKAAKELFDFIDVPKMPKRHWNNSNRWDMVEHMFEQVIKKGKGQYNKRNLNQSW
jgi:hypothetical protein